LVLHNHLPALLRQRGITWGELARRTLVPAARLRRLGAAHANPRLGIAERVAAALDLPLEAVWTLGRRRGA
jgi:predicted transcriptional regulator